MNSKFFLVFYSYRTDGANDGGHLFIKTSQFPNHNKCLDIIRDKESGGICSKYGFFISDVKKLNDVEAANWSDEKPIEL